MNWGRKGWWGSVKSRGERPEGGVGEGSGWVLFGGNIGGGGANRWVQIGGVKGGL